MLSILCLEHWHEDALAATTLFNLLLLYGDCLFSLLDDKIGQRLLLTVHERVAPGARLMLHFLLELLLSLNLGNKLHGLLLSLVVVDVTFGDHIVGFLGTHGVIQTSFLGIGVFGLENVLVFHGLVLLLYEAASGRIVLLEIAVGQLVQLVVKVGVGLAALLD